MRLFYWAGGVLLYLVFLAATVPVDALLWAFHGKVMAEGASGTLWRGEARRIVIAPGGKQAVSVGPAFWQIHPLRLLLGELSVGIRLDGDVRGKAEFSLGARGMAMRELDVSLPVTWLATLQPDIEMWQPGGTLILRGHDLTLQSGNYSGKGEIAWEQAVLGISPVRPLGDYLAEISGAGRSIRFQVHTRSGPLELLGSGTWSPQGLDFAGSARAREKEAELGSLLALAGKLQPDGSSAIAIKNGI